MAEMIEQSSYYILMTKCRTEIKTRDRLREDGHDVQCPLIVVKKKVRHKKAKIEIEVSKPLFDGYLFVNVDTAPSPERLKVTEDVLKIVAFNGMPSLISREDLYKVELLVVDLMKEEEERTKQRENLKLKNIKSGSKLRVEHGNMTVDGVYLGNNYMKAFVFGGEIKIKISHANIISVS